MPFEIIRDDITNLKVDAIVNPTNNRLKSSSGTCGAIFKKAGLEKLQKECDKIGHINTSEAVVTKGYDLNAKYIIHTVGPIWHGGNHDEEKILYKTYLNCLNLAKRKRIKSIAFPLISSGHFGFPNEKALKCATSAIKDFLSEEDMMIYLVIFDKKSFAISKKLFQSVKQYIDDNYIDNYQFSSRNRRRRDERDLLDNYLCDCMHMIENNISIEENIKAKAPKQIKSSKTIFHDTFKKKSLEETLSKLDETFAQMLFRLIDSTGKTDSEIYKKANIDRRLFSKIRKNKDYNPSKNTAIALAIALELDIDETKKLLEKAGFALSHSNKFDVIIEYFITEKNYNIFEINETLFAFDQNILKA